MLTDLPNGILSSPVLSACGYMGVYSNRTLEHGWVGQVEPVPWAA